MKRFFFPFLIMALLSACESDSGITGTDESTGEKYYGLTGDESGEGNGQGGDSTLVPGQITAGEWSDLEHWDFWKDLIQKDNFNKMPTYWSFDLSNRISVILTDPADLPQANVVVELLNSGGELVWTARTDLLGRAVLWPCQKYPGQSSVNGLKLRIGDEIYENPKSFEEGMNQIKWTRSTEPGIKKIDLAFMVDATGSMSDELEYLKVELVDVIKKVKEANPGLSLQMGSVFYRDEGDEYVTRISGFSSQVSTTIDFIKDQKADGGGDTPEAVHKALQKAIGELQWSSNATARILFILLDAPPHYESKIISEVHEQILLAASKGIKIIPVTASGIDKETEFLMRYFAMATQGTYVFITNHSGIGNEHLEASVGEYQVEFLNNLMVRLINKELQ